MEKKRILYRSGSSGRDEWMFKLSNELQNTMNHVPFFFCGRAGYHFFKNKINEKNILFLADENQTEIKKPDLQFLKAVEEKFNFNIWDLWEISAQRGRGKKTPPKGILILYEYIIGKFDNFLDKNKITDFVTYGTASSGDIILFKMMKQKGINIIALKASPLQKMFGISKDLSNNLYRLKENYHRIKKRDLSKEEQEEAFKVLQRCHERNYKPNCTVTYKESKIKKIKRYSKAVWKMIKYGQFPASFRPQLWGIIQKCYDCMNIFEKPVEGEKFVLLPLHHQPEATTLIYGKWYNNQLNLIENLIRSLPVGYKLYVKEHSFGYGNRSLRFYKEIKKYANVRLITPHFNNLELIKKSSLVVTITGTAGWEAIMFQKPVIIFGDVFYGVFDCVKKIEKIRDLPAAIRKLLDKKIDLKEVAFCLAALIKSAYPGLARLPGDCANHSLKDENIKLLAKGIIDHINKIQKL